MANRDVSLICIRVQCLLLLLVIYEFVSIETSCVEKEKRWSCGTFDDLDEISYKPDWTLLQLYNPRGKQNLQPLKENVFKNTPNVVDLQLFFVLNKIELNAFKGLDKLQGLFLSGNRLEEVKIGMFSNLPIKNLLLYDSEIKFLRPRSFDNLVNLEEVFVHKNDINRIENGVFSYTRLKLLYLNENNIQTIEPEAFFGMERLEKLAMERNRIATFDPAVFIGNTSPRLRLLWLAWNNLTRIASNSFTSYPDMRTLLLHKNQLTSLESNTFIGLQELRFLDLSNNNLESIYASAFPPNGLPKLDTLLIHNNRLTFLSSATLNKLPKLERITVGGNSWLCPCYQRLRKYLAGRGVRNVCDEEYRSGKRPICIEPDGFEQDHCFLLSNVNHRFSYLFENSVSDYGKLPPMCKMYCQVGNVTKPCYSKDFDVLIY